MILDDNSCEKPQIDYPCQWGYKIIGTNKVDLEECVFEIMGNHDYTTTKGNRSRKGKFHALTATCVVESQKDRDSIFKAFQDHKDIKMVL